MKWPMVEVLFVQRPQHPARWYHLSVVRGTRRTGQLMVTTIDDNL